MCPFALGGTAMLNQLLRRHCFNTYCGYELALWLIALVVRMKGAMSLNSLFNGCLVASSHRAADLCVCMAAPAAHSDRLIGSGDAVVEKRP